jgi:transporter family protein
MAKCSRTLNVVGNVSQVAPIDKLSVALTILLAVLFLGEALTIKTVIGAGLIVVGTVVLVLWISLR